MIANNEQKRITLGSIRTLVTRLTKVQTACMNKKLFSKYANFKILTRAGCTMILMFAVCLPLLRA